MNVMQKRIASAGDVSAISDGVTAGQLDIRDITPPPVERVAPESAVRRATQQLAVSTTVSSSTQSPADSHEPKTTQCRSIRRGESHRWPTVRGFEILGELGRGGMGVVYKARQISLNRLVALKMVLAGPHASPRSITRFLNEAAAVALLQHPHIVQVHELGDSDGTPFFALELIDGGDLRQKIGKKLPSIQEAAQLMEDISRAVHFAHERGIIHRDLKPENVLLTAEGTPKITDFGLAKQMKADSGLTSTGAVIGTPGYMSPEQANGETKEIGPGTDIYSLGVILYELLTGHRPFEAETGIQVIQQVINQEPPSPSWIRPGIPRDLETICLKCLRKEPGRRYETAAALADDLHRFLKNEPIAARRTSLLGRGVRRIKRHPLRTLASVLAVVLLYFGTARVLQYVNFERETVQYYRAVISRWDVKEGVGKITEEQMRHRDKSYRITRRGRHGPIIKTELVNGYGELYTKSVDREILSPAHSGESPRYECRWEYVYDADGRMVQQHAYDYTGHRTWSWQFTQKLSWNETSCRYITSGHYIDESGNAVAAAGSGVTGKRMAYSADGFSLGERFQDAFGNLKPDSDGSWGWQGKADERGQIVAWTNLGADGKPSWHRDGYVSYQASFDDSGNVVETNYLDGQGHPVLTRFGYSRVTQTYDKFGNLTEEAFFDTDRKPALSTDGFAGTTFKYDKRGCMVEGVYFGTDRRATLSKNDVARWTVKYDERGNQIEGKFFGTDGRPTLHAQGAAHWTAKYDERGNEIEASAFGIDGKPTRWTDGYAQWIAQYDERGNQVAEAYFDVDGKPTLCSQRIARWTAKFDARGNKIEQQYFGVDAKPTLHTQGIARWTAKYNERGNKYEQAYFGVDGKPTLNSQGVARWTAKYDARGNKIESNAFGVDGRPKRWTDGYARWTAKYNERGNRVEAAYFDVDGKPTLHAEGVARWTAKYDKRGNKIEQTYFGVDGKPMLNAQRFARWTAKYNERGNIVAAACFGVDRQPTLNSENVARWTAKFDARGNQIERAFFGVDGKPTRHTKGVARWTAKFDKRGNQIEQAYFGIDGKPALHTKGVARWTAKYDARGNQIEASAFGIDGKPARWNDGHAKWTAKYDERRNQIEEAYFDASGKPVTIGTGFVRWTAKFDARGNMIRGAYFGVDDKPVLTVNGYCRWTAALDAQGRPRPKIYYNLAGHVVLTRIVIGQVLSGGQGHRLGLKPGDIIVTYDGKTVSDTSSFIARRKHESDRTKSHPLQIQRKGKMLTFQLLPGLLNCRLNDRVVPGMKPQP